MTQKADTPLIAMLQTDPDPAWQPLLASLDEAKRSYDPVTQTGRDSLLADTAGTYRASGSGGAKALAAEDGGKKTYRTTSSGDAAAFPDDGDGGKKSYRTSTSGGAIASDDDSGGGKKTYRTTSSGGATAFPDDGDGGKKSYRASISGGPTALADDGGKGQSANT